VSGVAQQHLQLHPLQIQLDQVEGAVLLAQGLERQGGGRGRRCIVPDGVFGVRDAAEVVGIASAQARTPAWARQHGVDRHASSAAVARQIGFKHGCERWIGLHRDQVKTP
jgi:hypothetical protein